MDTISNTNYCSTVGAGHPFAVHRYSLPTILLVQVGYRIVFNISEYQTSIYLGTSHFWIYIGISNFHVSEHGRLSLGWGDYDSFCRRRPAQGFDGCRANGCPEWWLSSTVHTQVVLCKCIFRYTRNIEVRYIYRIMTGWGLLYTIGVRTTVVPFFGENIFWMTGGPSLTQIRRNGVLVFAIWFFFCVPTQPRDSSINRVAISFFTKSLSGLNIERSSSETEKKNAPLWYHCMRRSVSLGWEEGLQGDIGYSRAEVIAWCTANGCPEW